MEVENSILVFGEGPRDAKIVFVGQSPGAQEEKVGRPFIGPAGKLLDNCMKEAGILRSSCYLTNVVKEFPGPFSTDIKKIVDISTRGKPKTSPKWDTYLQMLQTELKALNPNVLVAVGNEALFALTGLTGISKWRGSIVESTLLPKVKVIPIIHPSASLRGNYHFKYWIANDLKKVRLQSYFPGIHLTEREYILRPSYAACFDYLEECRKKKVHGFDIEVTRAPFKEVSCISFSHSLASAISIPFVERGSSYFLPQQEVEIWKGIRNLLEDPKVVSIGQNVMFDSYFLYRKYRIQVTNMEDTMIAMAILYPTFPKGLDFITSIYTDLPYYKADGKERILRGGGSDNQFWLYNAKDSIVLMEAFPRMIEELERQGNIGTYLRQRDLLNILMEMTARGMRVDQVRMEEESIDSLNEIERLTAELERMVGYEVNPRSTRELQEYFYQLKGIKPYKNRKTGRTTLDRDALTKLAAKGHPEASIILRIRRLEKLNGTYYEMGLDEDGRLRSSMNPVGAARTGRLSSSKTIFGTGGNLQNQPKEVRKILLPDEGYVGYGIDLSQAENRIVAYVGPDPNMMEAFEEGVDIHSLTASYIFDKPVEEISSVPGSSTIGGGHRSERYWGKQTNHALNYDMGYVTFSYTHEIPQSEAKRLINIYHQAYPGVRRYQRKVREALSEGRTLINPYGRRRLFLDQWGHELFKDAYAWLPQSTVADKINKEGLIHIYYHEDLYPEVELLNQIHDEVVFQIPISVGWERHVKIIESIRRSLEEPIYWEGRKFSLPTTVSMHVENFGEGIEFKERLTPKQLEVTYEQASVHPY